MASEHLVRAYDEELQKLSNTIVEMGGLAESQLGTAIEAVATRDTELAGRVLEGSEARLDRAARPTSAARGGERCGGAEQAADHERAQAARL